MIWKYTVNEPDYDLRIYGEAHKHVIDTWIGVSYYSTSIQCFLYNLL